LGKNHKNPSDRKSHTWAPLSNFFYVLGLMVWGLEWMTPNQKRALVRIHVGAVLFNGNMTGKIPAWWENSCRGIGKRPEKIPVWWEISF
jgi:hypothetical protein